MKHPKVQAILDALLDATEDYQAPYIDARPESYDEVVLDLKFSITKFEAALKKHGILLMERRVGPPTCPDILEEE